jgi:hypothetical protein
MMRLPIGKEPNDVVDRIKLPMDKEPLENGHRCAEWEEIKRSVANAIA